MTVTVGILAHVDAGKTTLSEQLLFSSGSIRSAGRVDHGNTVMDSDPVERSRGITVFSDQADLEIGGHPFTLIDTPGHVDFTAEAERSLSALDLAILLLDGSSGVQAHTRALFSMLRSRSLPAFFFLNKNDLPGFDRQKTLSSLRASLTDRLVPVSNGQVDEEALADLDDSFCEKYLSGELRPGDAWQTLIRLTEQSLAFPVFEGAALSGRGLDNLLRGLSAFAEYRAVPPPDPSAPFRARVYAVRHDASGAKVTFLRILSGSLKLRQAFTDDSGTEKITRIRHYRGSAFTEADEALPGDAVGIMGLSGLRPGDLLTDAGIFPGPEALTRPVLSAQVESADGTPPETLLEKLKILNEEDPSLHLVWDQERKSTVVQIMGTVQTEVLTQVLADRFGLRVRFLPPRVLYRETLAEPVVGCGHYEPLRHYAEVRLRLEPAPRGSGITFESRCHEDILDKNWQRLIRTHVFEKQHIGVLTGSPLTDVRVVLLCGRDHLKHTEGGDFRQSVYRAVRQGLMKARSVLLEPWYRFTVTVPGSLAGRVMSDVLSMAGEYAPPETAGNDAVIRGRCPVSTMMDYPVSLRSFTHGAGDIQLESDGYDLCHNADQVVAEAAYDPDADKANPSGSVFCSHGAGFFVPWNVSDQWMHIHEKDYVEVPPRDL